METPSAATAPSDNPAKLFASFVSGVSTYVATLDRFGTAGALIFAGLILASIYVLGEFGPRVQAKMFPALNRFFHPKLAYRLTLVLAGAAVTLGVALWLSGKASILLIRSEFTRTHDHVGLQTPDYAANVFAEATAPQVRHQRDGERAVLTNWVRWMSEGADKPIHNASGAVVEERRLLYLEGIPFEADFVTINAFVTVAAAVQIHDVAAFLMDENDEDVWYKPRWQQLFGDVSPDHGSVSISVTNPKRGTRLAVFLQVSPRTGQAMPSLDRMIPSQQIGVRK